MFHHSSAGAAGAASATGAGAGPSGPAGGGVAGAMTGGEASSGAGGDGCACATSGRKTTAQRDATQPTRGFARLWRILRTQFGLDGARRRPLQVVLGGGRSAASLSERLKDAAAALRAGAKSFQLAGLVRFMAGQRPPVAVAAAEVCGCGPEAASQRKDTSKLSRTNRLMQQAPNAGEK